MFSFFKKNTQTSAPKSSDNTAEKTTVQVVKSTVKTTQVTPANKPAKKPTVAKTLTPAQKKEQDELNKYVMSLRQRLDNGESQEVINKEYSEKVPALQQKVTDATLNFIKEHPDYDCSAQLITTLEDYKDMEAAEKTADSIMNALAAGANFDSIAKKYNQPAEKIWITSAQYEGQTLDENNRKFINTLTTAAVGSNNKIVLDGQGVIIAQITDRRNIINKYDVAVIKRAIDFSKDTYGKAYNDFASFLAGNPKAEDIEANASKAGYNVQTRTMANTEHTVAGVHSTRETLRWIFNEDTKIGDVSPLYECGDNDHLLVVMLTGINEKGYMRWDDEQGKAYLTSEVQKDKKAAKLQEKMKAAKNIADVAKMEGAVTDTIKHVNFANNAFISKVGNSEPALSGSVSAAKKGDFKAGIKGNGAVYAYQVLNQTKSDVKFDVKQEKQQAAQMSMRALSAFTNELYLKADVQDKRYLFY